MTGAGYLRGVLRKYAVNAVGAKAAGQSIYPVLQSWSNGYMEECFFSGSLAKGTAVSIGTDADIFISMASSLPGSLAEMYNTLFNALSYCGHKPRRQNVSIGVAVNGYSIDLVPGRRQSNRGNDHSLYRNKVGSWTQTNIEKHLSYVRESNRIEEIKVMKVWRALHQLEFPSFYLELAVIDGLRYSRTGDLASNVMSALIHLEETVESLRYIDPANTSNIVSDDCTSSEKAAIARQARASRSQPTWERIVW